MRLLKIAVLLMVLIGLSLVATLSWLVRSEQGSRWLVEQGLTWAPVAIEAGGVTGTLAEGLAVESVSIQLPMAYVRARDVVVSWSPTMLLTGIVRIDNAAVAELSVDTFKSDSSSEAPDDRLFWLDFPLYVSLESGHIDQMRIEAAEFSDLRVAGGIGEGRLAVTTLSARIAGADVQISGDLTGPSPGLLEASGSWVLPAANLQGAGQLSGDIDKLAVTHVLSMPDAVNFEGHIYDLFAAPTVVGNATWLDIKLPGSAVLHSRKGMAAISSDFRSARVDSDSVMLLEGWPAAPLHMEAVADIRGISIDAFVLQALGGQVSGAGRVAYEDGLQGELRIIGKQLDTGVVDEALAGQIGFESTLLIESADVLSIDVAAARALLAGEEYSGRGRAEWQFGKWSSVAADITAGANQLSANVKLGERLAGTVTAKLPNLARLWPELSGSAEGEVRLGGSPANPEARFNGTAADLKYDSQAIDRLSVYGELTADGSLEGALNVTGLVAGEQELGSLDVALGGTLPAFRTRLQLTGSIVSATIRSEGGWDGAYLTQRFVYGQVEPAGFESWLLDREPLLRVSAEGGQLGAHCWKQAAASICLQSGNWDANRQQIAVLVDSFALASLKPLLADGYSIDGEVDAAVSIVGSDNRLRGTAHWRQSRTVIGYADEIDEFQTELEAVQIDITSTDERTDMSARVGGEAGLTLTATATILGPVADASPVVASANGSLPSIGLLRPFVQRVVQPGELQGELSIDLKVEGTLGDPVFTGGAYLADGVLGLLDTGITLTDINLAAESNSSDSLKLTGRLRSGNGQAELSGDIRSNDNAEDDLGLVANVSITGDNLAIVRSPDLNVDASPDLALSIREDVFDITGVINIPYARAQVRDLPQNAVSRSADVIVHTPERAAAAENSGTILAGDVEVILGNDVRFNGFGLDSRLAGSLRLTQKRGGFLRSAGTVRVREGFLTGYGKELRVDRGDLTFVGPLDDPLINVQVSRESIYDGRQYTVGLRLTGSAQNVQTEPFSRPSMSDNDVLAFLLIDRPAGTGANASGAAVAMGLGQLVPGDGGLLGLDEVGFETNEANQAAMVAGKRINDDIFVRYVFGSLGEPGAFRIRYRLGKGFSLEASTGSAQSLDIIYLLER